MALEPVVAELQPDRVTGVGNVNSTLAGTLVCGRWGFPRHHTERPITIEGGTTNLSEQAPMRSSRP